MIMTNKLLPVALIAALIGGSVGALVMHSRNSTASNQAIAQDTTRPVDAQFAGLRTTEAQRDSYVPAEFDTVAEQTAYKSGFADGFRAAEAGITGERAGLDTYCSTGSARCLQKHAAAQRAPALHGLRDRFTTTTSSHGNAASGRSTAIS